MSNGDSKKDPLEEIGNLIGKLENEINALNVEEVFKKRAKSGLLEGIYELRNDFRTAQQIFDVHKE